jgi:hypothetical protein
MSWRYLDGLKFIKEILNLFSYDLLKLLPLNHRKKFVRPF